MATVKEKQAEIEKNGNHDGSNYAVLGRNLGLNSVDFFVIVHEELPNFLALAEVGLLLETVANSFEDIEAVNLSSVGLVVDG